MAHNLKAFRTTADLLHKSTQKHRKYLIRNLDCKQEMFQACYEILKNYDPLCRYVTKSVAHIFFLLFDSFPDTRFILSSFNFSSTYSRFFLIPLTSLSWLVIVSRVTGLLGLLLSLTGGMCPFLMIGTVVNGWPGVCGCGTAWTDPAEEASLEPSVRYCFTGWFWLWWRWNLELSRWLCTCREKQIIHQLS